ncbi:MAG: DUF6263 family protein [Planctomycetales bacterium]
MSRRVRWSWCVSAALGSLLGAAGQGSAQETVEMRWKLAAGQRLAVTQTQNMNMEMKFGDQAITMDVNMEMNMRWDVDTIESDGDAAMTQTIDRIRMEMKMPNQAVKFDSATPDAADPLGKTMAQAMMPIIGAKITQTMDPRGKVKELKLDPAVQKQLQAASGAMGGLSEESLKQMVEQMGGLPEQPVAVGAKWSETVDLPLPGAKSAMKVDSTFQGIEDRDGRKLARIDIKFGVADAKPAAPASEKDEAEAAPPFEVKSIDGSGKQFFDVQAGRLVEADSKFSIVMTADVGGQKADQKATATSRIVIEPAK